MLFRIDSLSIEVSGHGGRIKDMDGDKSDGLGECLSLCLLRITVTNEMEYH